MEKKESLKYQERGTKQVGGEVGGLVNSEENSDNTHVGEDSQDKGWILHR